MYYIKVDLTKTGLDLHVIHFFNDSYVCTASSILPETYGMLNFLVEKYNDTYVIISSKEWKAYLEGGVVTIKLIYPEEDIIPYFLWMED